MNVIKYVNFGRDSKISPFFIWIIQFLFVPLRHQITIKTYKAMRQYQENIISAILSRKDFMGGNTSVKTDGNKTIVTYYWVIIGVIDHENKTVHYDNGGYTNAATTARINAVRIACENELGYKVI